MKRKHELKTKRPISAEGEELFCPLELSPQFKGDNTSRNNKLRGKYTIYTVNTWKELVQDIRQANYKEHITLRFLLTPKYELLFAKEGAPNSYIPAHFAMTGLDQNASLCKTAGNIVLDENNTIIFISHKSGDFQPSWDSLKYGLLALLACGFNFADEFQIGKYVNTLEIFDVKLDSLQKEIDSKFSAEQKDQCREANRNLSTNTYEYPKVQNKVTGRDRFFANYDEYESPTKKTCKTPLDFF